MMSPLSVGEYREAVRAWSEGYRTIEGGGWDHGKMIMMMMVVVMKEMMVTVMKLKHVMVKMMISLKWNQQIKFGTLQVNYIEDRSVHLAPAQRREILEVPICLQMLSLKLNWFILSVPSIHVATPSTHPLVNLHKHSDWPIRKLGVSVVIALPALKTKTNQLDCFSCNYNQGWMVAGKILMMTKMNSAIDSICSKSCNKVTPMMIMIMSQKWWFSWWKCCQTESSALLFELPTSVQASHNQAGLHDASSLSSS